MGAVKILQPPGDPSGQDYEKGGAIVLLVALLILIAAAIFVLTFYKNRQGPAWLIAGVLISIPLLVIRFVWSLIDVFTQIYPQPSQLHLDFALPEAGGNIAIYVCLAILPGMLITIVINIAGFLSNPDKYNYDNNEFGGKATDSEMSSPQRPNYGVEGARPNYGADGRRPNY